jgi:predicted helicase
MVGQTADRGADVLAHKFKKRWLFQIKHWKTRIGLDVIDRTLDAMRTYRADIPVVVALNGFEDSVREHQSVLIGRGIAIQLWDGSKILERAEKLSNASGGTPVPKEYQEEPIRSLVQAYAAAFTRRALVVMATGLGKTFIAAEAIRRINILTPVRTLVIAHTNEIVYQLERAFWPFLTVEQETLVWNGYEQPTPADMQRAPFVFSSLN